MDENPGPRIGRAYKTERAIRRSATRRGVVVVVVVVTVVVVPITVVVVVIVVVAAAVMVAIVQTICDEFIGCARSKQAFCPATSHAQYYCTYWFRILARTSTDLLLAISSQLS